MENLDKFVALAELGEKLLGLVKESGLLKKPRKGVKGARRRRNVVIREATSQDVENSVAMLPSQRSSAKRAKRRSKKRRPAPIPIPVEATA